MNHFCRRMSRWFLAGLFCFLCSSPGYGAKYHFKILGDSLSAGFLANTSILDEVRRRELRPIKRRQLVYHVLQWCNPDEPHHQLDKFNAPNQAWPFFPAERFTEKGSEVAVSNLAVSGALTKDLSLQIRALAKDSKIDAGKKTTTRAKRLSSCGLATTTY